MNIYLAAWLIDHGDPDADFDRISEAERIVRLYVRNNGISELQRIKASMKTIDGQPVMVHSAMVNAQLPVKETKEAKPKKSPPPPKAKSTNKRVVRFGKTSYVAEDEVNAAIDFVIRQFKATGLKNIRHKETIKMLNENRILIGGRRWQRPAFASFVQNYVRPLLDDQPRDG